MKRLLSLYVCRPIRIAPSSFDRSIDDFADAMRWLDRDSGLVERRGTAGRRRVLGRFTGDRKFDIADGIYRQLFLETAPHA